MVYSVNTPRVLGHRVFLSLIHSIFRKSALKILLCDASCIFPPLAQPICIAIMRLRGIITKNDKIIIYAMRLMVK